MAFDVRQFIDGLFRDDGVSSSQSECVWINTEEFANRTAGMSAEQVGRLLLEIVDLHKRGLMKNGPSVRVSPPEDEEAKDGTHP
jgi:hypothetical protein